MLELTRLAIKNGDFEKRANLREYAAPLLANEIARIQETHRARQSAARVAAVVHERCSVQSHRMEQRSLLPVIHDVPPLLAKERADDPDGLWATKQYGDLKVYTKKANRSYCSSTLVSYPNDSSMVYPQGMVFYCCIHTIKGTYAYYESVLVDRFERSSLMIARRSFSHPLGSTLHRGVDKG